MGTIVTVDIFLDEPLAPMSLEHALAQARTTFENIDATFSTWIADSPLSKLRRGEIAVADCPPEVAEVLELCEVVRDITQGVFDPWSLPGGVDPTGLVKGWATTRALECFRDVDAHGVIINAAGDIATRGAPSLGETFHIGVVDPRDRQKLCCVVNVPGAIATSASYERGAHLFDPAAQQFLDTTPSASVTGPDLAVADALATALAVGGAPMLDVLEDLAGYEGLLVDLDAPQWTLGFPFVSHAWR